MLNDFTDEWQESIVVALFWFAVFLKPSCSDIQIFENV